MVDQLDAILDSIVNPQLDNAVNTKETLLIIDDNQSVIDALSVILSKDYKLIISHSYEETITKLNPTIKVVLLDIKMAYKNGIEVFSLLKESNPNLKIIFHSGYPGNDDLAILAESLPHSGYLTKGNYDITELLQTIKRAFQDSK